MKLFKSKLDEMQEQKIARIEIRGLYLAVIGLLLAILFQGIFCTDISAMMGEFIILEVICVYVGISYIKHGVWDRFFKPGIKNYLVCSVVAGVVVAVFAYILAVIYGPIRSIAVDILLAFIPVFVLVLIGNLILAFFYKRQRKKLEGTPEQKELADKVGVASETIRAIEEGTYNPSIALCREICRNTGKTLDELFCTEEVSET